MLIHHQLLIDLSIDGSLQHVLVEIGTNNMELELLAAMQAIQTNRIVLLRTAVHDREPDVIDRGR